MPQCPHGAGAASRSRGGPLGRHPFGATLRMLPIKRNYFLKIVPLGWKHLWRGTGATDSSREPPVAGTLWKPVDLAAEGSELLGREEIPRPTCRALHSNGQGRSSLRHAVQSSLMKPRIFLGS